MSQSTVHGSLGDLVDDIAHGLRETALELRKAGYRYFQFDEPSLCAKKRTESELDMARYGLEICAKGIDAKTSVQTYFGDAGPVIGALLEYPIDCIGLDFYATSLEALREHSFEKELGCGCVDGRNSLLESSEDLIRFVSKVREDLEPRSLSICPNSDLAFLPHSIAEKKVRLLSEIKKKMGT
jgi:methionine synthase II (cobalamin-independent)